MGQLQVRRLLLCGERGGACLHMCVVMATSPVLLSAVQGVLGEAGRWGVGGGVLGDTCCVRVCGE